MAGNIFVMLVNFCSSAYQDMGLGHICEGLAEQQNGGLQTLVLWNNQLTHQGMSYLSRALVS